MFVRKSSRGVGATSCPSRRTSRHRGRTSWPPSPSLRPAPPPSRPRRAGSIDRACEVDKRHARIEKRRLEVTTWLTEYLEPDWPGCQQVFRLEQQRRTKGKVEVEVVFGIASLPRERTGARALLGVTRGHWGIENGLRGVRDGTLREDASRIRKGSGLEVMAETPATKRTSVKDNTARSERQV